MNIQILRLFLNKPQPNRPPKKDQTQLSALDFRQTVHGSPPSQHVHKSLNSTFAKNAACAFCSCPCCWSLFYIVRLCVFFVVVVVPFYCCLAVILYCTLRGIRWEIPCRTIKSVVSQLWIQLLEAIMYLVYPDGLSKNEQNDFSC